MRFISLPLEVLMQSPN